MGNGDPQRDAIHQTIQEQGPHEIKKAAVLVGWALVADWMDEDGVRWLSRMYSPSVTIWQAKGMWHDALNGEWPGGDDDEPE